MEQDNTEMGYQNRIIGTGDVKVDSILYNPKNWRIHPKYQQDALEEVLEKVGWVQTVIINKTTGNLIDGHLRAQMADRRGEITVPAVYVELTEEEENVILATFDPISAMAVSDRNKMRDLLEHVRAGREEIRAIVEEISEGEMLREFSGYERPTFDIGDFIEDISSERGGNTKNENWFYVEYYQQNEKWDELTKHLEPYMIGPSKHNIDPNIFYEMVVSYEKEH